MTAKAFKRSVFALLRGHAADRHTAKIGSHDQEEDGLGLGSSLSSQGLARVSVT